MLFLLSGVLALVPSLLLVGYFYKRDLNPEPARLLWATFGLGCLTIPIVLVVALPLDWLAKLLPSIPLSTLGQAFFGAAIPEEAAKLLVVLLFVVRRRSFNEPMDGIVYGAVAGLGFATLENVLYVATGGIPVAILRAVTAVPGHAFCGAIMGYFVGRARFAGGDRRMWYLQAIGWPTLLHGLYDWPLLWLDRLANKEGVLATGLVVAAFAVLVTEWLWTTHLVRLLRREQEQVRQATGAAPGTPIPRSVTPTGGGVTAVPPLAVLPVLALIVGTFLAVAGIGLLAFTALAALMEGVTTELASLLVGGLALGGLPLAGGLLLIGFGIVRLATAAQPRHQLPPVATLALSLLLLSVPVVPGCSDMDRQPPGDAHHSDSGTDSGEVDMGDAPPPDTGRPEPDLGPQPDAGELAGYREACEQNSDCQSGFCIPAAGGYVCTHLCWDECEDGWLCRGVRQQGSDPVFICMPPEDRFCIPCMQDEDCGDGRCVALDAQDSRKYCVQPCPADQLCRAGYACRPLTAEGRELGDHCLPVSGTCSCTEVTAGLDRLCTASNELGTCVGQQTCVPETGWSQCNAPWPELERCNQQDDDCNGLADDLADRGKPCERTVELANGRHTCRGYWMCKPDDEALNCSAAVPTEESCDGEDNDCDGEIDEGLTGAPCSLQQGVCAGSTERCGGGLGWLGCTMADYGEQYEPLESRCDGLDNDCDGEPDNVDLDLDGQRSVDCGGADCDDLNPLAHPGQAEICGDGVDNDCNGQADDLDADEDGHLAAACGGDDCNDRAAAARPGLPELCGDGLDNDCDGSLDNKDEDQDRFIDEACGGTDCDDTKPGVRPGGVEACNGEDDDCNGVVDDVDQDRDGYRDAACGGTDCNDRDPAIHPGLQEVCGNAADEDCSGAADDRDLDRDGHRDPACGGDDCDDGLPTVHPGAREQYDTRDNDCDGLVDEGLIPAGALVVTELLARPLQVGAVHVEWFELYNRWDYPVNLASWTVAEDEDGTTESFTIDARLLIEPGGYAVLCEEGLLDERGNVHCQYEYPAGRGPGTFSLEDDGPDTLRLLLGDQLIDRIRYDLSPAEGVAYSLDPNAINAAANDNLANWCPATTLHEGGFRGTPGVRNPDCGEPVLTSVTPNAGIDNGGETVTLLGRGFAGTTDVRFDRSSCASWTLLDDQTLRCITPAHSAAVVDVTVAKGERTSTKPAAYTYHGEAVRNIDWCNIQFPRDDFEIRPNGPADVYGRVRSRGVTEAAGAPAGISFQVGYGPSDSDPRNDPGWQWTTGQWHTQLANDPNDEFKATFTVAQPGIYRLAVRFSDDNGVNYMYCDRDPGTADGFFPRTLLKLTVQ